MSNQEMTVEEILGYKASTLSILNKQIEILQQAEQRILPKKADLHDDKAKDSVLTVEKSGELQEILSNEINKLENFDVVLAVVGTMKAGKSTTINAIVGREILPNRNRPMTALPTLICHNPAKQIPSISIDPTVLNQFLSQLQAKLHLVPKSDKMHQDMHNLIDFIADGGQFNNYYEGEENIFEFLYQLNDLVRLSKDVSNAQAEQGEKEILHFPFDEYKNFNNLPMIEVAFKLDSDFETQGRFMLLDTAGPNEAGHRELKKLLAEQLERSSAVMIVLDYTQLNSDAEKDVKDQIDKIPTVQKSRLFALVNKCDLKDANSDEADATRKHIFNNLLKDKIELDNIYAISAQNAYLAKRMKAYIELNGDKPEYQPETWIEDCAKKMFGEMAEEDYEDANVASVEKRLTRLMERSHMAQPIENIIVNMQRNAPFIAIQSALAGVSYVFDRLHNTLNIKKVFAEKMAFTEEEIAELQKKINELKENSDSLEKQKNKLQESMGLIKAKIYDETEIEQKIQTIHSEMKKVVETHFRVINTNAQRDLKKQQDKNRSWLEALKFKTEDEVKKEYIRQTQLENNVSEDSEKIIFSQKQESEKFKDNITEAVNRLIKDNITPIFEEIFNDSLSSIKNIIGNINNEASNFSVLLKEKFKTENLELRIDCDLEVNWNKEIAKIDKIELTLDTENIDETIEMKGFFGGIKRLIGKAVGKDLGTYHVKQNIPSLSKEQVIKEVMQLVDEECVKPLQKQIDDQVQQLLDSSTDSINKFSEKVNQIIYELQQSLDEQKYTVNKSKQEKEDEKQFISSLKQSHDDLDVDWQKLKEKFKVEDIKS